MDVSLPFGLHWVAACCQDVTTLITRAKEESIKVLAYIDDFEGVAQGKNLACMHFKQLLTKLQQLGLQEALHKVAHPATNMVWLGLKFDSCSMTMSIPQEKLQEALQLAEKWNKKPSATLHQLNFLGKIVPRSPVFAASKAVFKHNAGHSQTVPRVR